MLLVFGALAATWIGFALWTLGEATGIGELMVLKTQNEHLARRLAESEDQFVAKELELKEALEQLRVVQESVGVLRAD